MSGFRGLARQFLQSKSAMLDFTLLDVTTVTSQDGWLEAVNAYPEVSGHFEDVDKAIKAEASELAALQAYEKAKSDTEVVWAEAQRSIGC